MRQLPEMAGSVKELSVARISRKALREDIKERPEGQEFDCRWQYWDWKVPRGTPYGPGDQS